MKNAKQLMMVFIVIMYAINWSGANAQTPLGSGFTFQGQLQDGGSPANGMYDLDFSLHDAAAAGNQIGSTVSFIGLAVSDGLFTVDLDYGASSLNGDERWIEVSVDGNILSPRQPVKGAPYSVQTRGIFVNQPTTFVGVGREFRITSREHFGIHAPVSTGYGGMYISTDGNDALPFYGYASGGPADMWHYYDGAVGDWNVNNNGDRLTVANDGFVGVGRKTAVSPDEVFGIYKSTTGLGGMYVETLSTGAPLYGYSAGGDVDAFHYIDGVTGKWHLNNGGLVRFSIDSEGYVGVGRDSVVTGADKFGVHSPASANQYGGMYLTTTSEEAWPFYGYAAGGTADCWTYYNGSNGNWNVYNSGNRLTVESSGQVGINQIDPNFTLEVNGSAAKPGGGSWSSTSDRRLKKNIVDLDGSLEKLMRLRGVTFEYSDPNAINELEGPRIGVIAQEVEKVFPDWVDQRKDGYKAVTFRGFEALAVEAIRELRAEKDNEIQTLQTENEELRERLANLEATVQSLMARQP